MNEQLLLDPGIKTFFDSINELKNMEDELFTDNAMETILNSINDSFSGINTNQAINQIIQNLEIQGMSRAEVQSSVEQLKVFIKENVYGDTILIENKRKVIDAIVENIFNIFDAAFDKYHSYAIELPIQLEEGAQVPVYAHESDACADMYSMEEIEIPAHYKSVPVKTGVHIQLPEGWVALLFPRSSIGAKTGLRLSNSTGIIDSGYRGEIRALYDNTSDEPYTIHKGDRIAQLMVMPSYRFKAKVVESLESSDRGEAGFGSTGV